MRARADWRAFVCGSCSAAGILVISGVALGQKEPSRQPHAAHASTPSGGASSTQHERLCSTTTERQHVLGALYEHEQAVGVRYHHTHVDISGCGEAVLLWVGYGLDLRVVMHDFERTDAGLAQLSARAGMFAGAGVGLSVELGAGGGPTRDGARAIGFLGGFASFYFVDLGAVYFLPLGPFDRPSWLGNASFAARIHVPVGTYDEHTVRY